MRVAWRCPNCQLSGWVEGWDGIEELACPAPVYPCSGKVRFALPNSCTLCGKALDDHFWNMEMAGSTERACPVHA